MILSLFPEHEVQVWTASLEQPEAPLQEWEQTLSEDERARAGRFHLERDRRRYVVGRGLLRCLLALYLGTIPTLLEFCYGPRGKPYLARPCGEPRLQFNLAHSGRMIIYAIRRGGQIGIDLERVRVVPEAERITEQLFSPLEKTWLHAQPKDERINAFFRLWTLKEAYLKALGDGLAQPLGEFEISFPLSDTAPLLKVHSNLAESARWSLQEIHPAPGYTGALCVEKSQTATSHPR